jgi:hypothetical protein
MKNTYFFGTTWVIATIAIVAMVRMVYPCFSDSSSVLDYFLVFVWDSIPYLTWAFLAWLTRKHAVLSTTSFVGGLAVCGGGIWWFYNLHAGSNSLEAVIVVAALPLIQLMCLSAIVGFPVLLVHLDKLERPT